MSPLRFGRAAIVAVLAFTFALQNAGAEISLAALIPAVTGQTATPLSVTLDGRSLGAIAISRPGATPLIEVGALATALKWQVTITPAGANVDDGSGLRALRVGSRFIREDGTDVETFDEPLVERNDRLMLAFPDALSFFSINGSFTATTIMLTGAVVSQTDIFTTKEVPEPINTRPKPKPAATPAPTFGSPFDPGLADMSVSLDLDGSSRFYRLGLASNTNFIHAHVNAAGIQTLGPPDGTVTLGAPTRNASFGEQADPLGGLILPGNGFEGGTLFSRNGDVATSFVAGRRTDGHTIIGVERALPGSNKSNTIAVVSQNGVYNQTVFRHAASYKPSWGSLSDEWLASERGIGAGVSAQTHGRTFLQSTLTFATGGLPVGINDAPVNIALGRNLSPATTVTSGFYTARGTPFAPYVGVQTSGSNLRLFANASPNVFTAGVSYLGPIGNVQLLTQPGINRLLELQSQLRFHHLEADINVATQSTSSEADVELETTHSGINLVTGFSTLSGGRSGPILGVSVPVSRSLALEVSERPGSIGKYALRFSVHAGLPPRRVRVVMFPLTVGIDGPGDAAPLRLLVDGIPTGQLGAGIRQATVKLTQGQHDVFVETLDGTSGSPSHSITMTAATTLQVTLFPERVIRGHVRFNATAAEIPPDASLSGIKLTVAPGGIVVDADADGNFLFPRQPLDPEAVLSVDQDTLPRGFEAPAPIRLGDAQNTIDVPLTPRRVERQVFH